MQRGGAHDLDVEGPLAERACGGLPNDRERLDPESIVATMDYEHPVYTPEAVRAQSRLSSLATGRTVYAGAYHGWGFHEDGCRSGVEAARHFGVAW